MLYNFPKSNCILPGVALASVGNPFHDLAVGAHTFGADKNIKCVHRMCCSPFFFFLLYISAIIFVTRIIVIVCRSLVQTLAGRARQWPAMPSRMKATAVASHTHKYRKKIRQPKRNHTECDVIMGHSLKGSFLKMDIYFLFLGNLYPTLGFSLIFYYC